MVLLEPLCSQIHIEPWVLGWDDDKGHNASCGERFVIKVLIMVVL